MFQPHVSDSRTYGVKFQARCLAPVVADKTRSRFLIGTLSLREENEVRALSRAVITTHFVLDPPIKPGWFVLDASFCHSESPFLRLLIHHDSHAVNFSLFSLPPLPSDSPPLLKEGRLLRGRIYAHFFLPSSRLSSSSLLYPQIHLIELSEDGYSVTCEGLFRHQHEIWDLATCPFDDSLISTVYSSGELQFRGPNIDWALHHECKPNSDTFSWAFCSTMCTCTVYPSSKILVDNGCRANLSKNSTPAGDQQLVIPAFPCPTPSCSWRLEPMPLSTPCNNK